MGPGELAVSAILEQLDDAGVFQPVAFKFESRKLTQSEGSYPLHVLKLQAVVHARRCARTSSTSPRSCTGTT